MNEYLVGISQLIANNHAWGFFFAFLFAFLEALPIFGTIIPGLIIIPFIGLYIGNGVLPAMLTIQFTFLGAVIGDILSYWVGRVYAPRIKNWRWFQQHDHYVKKAEYFIDRYGAYCIVIGRFIGPMRSSVPFFTGILGLKPLGFTIAAIISAWLWSIVYLLPGVITGAFAINIPPDAVVTFLIKIILVGALFEGIRQRQCLFNAIAKRYSQDIIIIQHSISAIVILSALVILFSQLSAMHAVNQQVWSTVLSFQTHTSIEWFTYLARVGDKMIMCITVIIMICWSIKHGSIKSALHLGIKMLLIVAAVMLSKHILSSPRPLLDGLISHHGSNWDSHSFPSGHVALISMYLWHLSTWKFTNTRVFNSISILIILIICVSRIALSEHWFTDVIGSLLIAGFIHHSYQLIYSRSPTEYLPSSSQNLGLGILVFITCISSWIDPPHINMDYFIPQPKTAIISSPNWPKETQHLIPKHRMNRLGYTSDPFNLIIKGSHESISGSLKQHNWEIQPYQPLISKRLMNLWDKQRLVSMPLLPGLYLNQPPTMTATKVTKRGLLIIKLWSSYQTTKELDPIYIGHIQMKPWPVTWYNLIKPLSSDSFNQLHQIQDVFHHHLEDRPHNNQQMAPHWNGIRWFLST